MPDLMNHLAVTHLARRGIEAYRGEELGAQEYTLLYVGGFLPDIPSRTPILALGTQEVYWLTVVNHSPLLVLLFAYLLVMVLPVRRRMMCFTLVSAGAALHCFLDLLQRHLISGSYFWFYPFSWKTFQLSLFWPSDAIMAVPVLLAMVVAVEMYLRGKGRRRRNVA